MDSGRREREGFDQHGIVRVIPVPSSSASTPTPRHQRAASVFQDIEGAAREAKRKFIDTGINTNDSSPRPAATTPSQSKEQTDPQHHQSKRPRLTAETDPQSPSPPERFHSTTSSPVYYNGKRVPSFAHPRGHRRHLTNTSPGSPEIGLGLGITASPMREKIARNKLNADEIRKPSSIPPPPPRYSLRGSTNSSPPEGSSLDDSPLGNRKPAKRPCNSVPRETSRNDDKCPRTRAALKASGSGTGSHQAVPSSARVTVPKLSSAQQDLLEKDKKELQEFTNLLEDTKINPECLPFLQKISSVLQARIKSRAAFSPTGAEREQIFHTYRKQLRNYRESIERFKKKGEFYTETDGHADTSEDEDASDGPGGDRDEGSEKDMSTKNPKRPGIEMRDLSADFAAARRISSLRARSTALKTRGSPQSQRDKEPDGPGIQVLIGDNGTEQASPSPRASSARASQSNGAVPEDAAIKEIENEHEDDTTESEGEDIQFEAEVPKVEHCTPIRNPTTIQRASSRNAPLPRAGPGEGEHEVNAVLSTAK